MRDRDVRVALAGALLAPLLTTSAACILLEQYAPPVGDPIDAGTGGASATASSGTSGGHGGATTSATGPGGADAGGCKPGASQGCYTGPPNTEGVGVCKPGTSTCPMDGSAWGPCVGEVLPTAENCATPDDENCDGETPPCAPPGTTMWARAFGGTQLDGCIDLATDPIGNVYLAGAFSTTVDFGGGPLVSAGGLDAFVAKYDANGAFAMAKRFGDAEDQLAQGIAVDGTGDVYLAGTFASMIDFGGPAVGLVSAGSTDVFVAKLSAVDGTPLWAKGFGDAVAQTMSPRGLAADAAGDVAITGSFEGSINFGGGPLVSKGNTDVFVAELYPDGHLAWAESFGDAAAQTSSGVAIGPGGEVAITGTFEGSIDFGDNDPLTSAGGKDIFVALFDSMGNHLWSYAYGDAADQEGLAITFDNAGNVYVTGSTLGSVDFGGGPLAAVGVSPNMVVAKLASNGSHLLSRRYGDGSPPGQSARSVAVDKSGNVVIGGDFGGALDFGSSPIFSVGSTDAFVAKLDPSWNAIFTERYGDVAAQTGSAVTTDLGRSVFFGGAFAGSITFGVSPLVSAGNTDAFVVKLSQ